MCIYIYMTVYIYIYVHVACMHRGMYKQIYVPIVRWSKPNFTDDELLYIRQPINRDILQPLNPISGFPTRLTV